MTWIKTIRPEDADPQLLDLLQKTRAMYPPDTRRRSPTPAARASSCRTR